MTESQRANAALDLILSTTRTTFAPGDSVEATLTLVNRGEKAVTLSFSSGQRYDLFVVSAAGDTLWTWSADQSFTQMLGEERLPAGGSLHYGEKVPVPTPPGRYRLVGMITSPEAPPPVNVVLTVQP